MAKVYILTEDRSTKSMPQIFCKDESKELQNILEKNPDLIPGDQIEPLDPRCWLIVKKEMPVPDPQTGGSRWSIDFFFVDQDAIPTFIECKRFNDTRSRREVVGQMLEYAANGHYYWEKEELIEFAKSTAQKKGIELEEEMKRLQPESPDSVDDFFQKVQNYLREGKIRLIFFLEKAPIELKSVVDFLNKQMDKAEVCLVEASQYMDKGMKFIVPNVFGYTEEARHIKRTVSIVSGPKKQWNENSFFDDAEKKLTQNNKEVLRKIYYKCKSLLLEMSWGKGKVTGSYSVKWPQIGNDALFNIRSDGVIVVNFGSFNKNDKEKEIRDFFKDKITNKLGLDVPENYEKRYPEYKISEIIGKEDILFDILNDISKKYPINKA